MRGKTVLCGVAGMKVMDLSPLGMAAVYRILKLHRLDGVMIGGFGHHGDEIVETM